jgi:hypothetical protein
MSQLGAPPTPPPPYQPPVLPPGRTQSSDIPTWVVAVAIAVAVGLAGLLGFVVLHGHGEGHSAAPTHRVAHHYPKHWNHKIAPLARYTAKQRGLAFEHPVAVRFASDAAFDKGLRNDVRLGQRLGQRQALQTAQLMRAFGLATAQPDLVRGVRYANSHQALAYYSYHAKRLWVRGHALTPAVRAALVHELTLVLQDQHFRTGPRLRKLANGTSTHPAYVVLDALTETDALRIEDRYRGTLSAAQARAVAAEDHREKRLADRDLARLPQAVRTDMEAPYYLGAALTKMMLVARGNGEANRLLHRAPGHDVALIDPLRVLDGDTDAVRVTPPALAHGDRRVGSGEFGAVSWYLLLSSRLPASSALDAADGWAGDSYVTYRHAGATCARLTFAGRTSGDASRMYAAVRQWADAATSRTSASMTGRRVHVTTCGPDKGAATGSIDQTPAMRAAITRGAFAIGIFKKTHDLQTARCGLNLILTRVTPDELADRRLGQQPSVQTRIQQVIAQCTGGTGS